MNKTVKIDWNTTDLVTCVELNYETPDTDAREDSNDELKDVYHFIYASQLYGALFGIYGKFDFSKDDLKLKGVDLQLLNYQGTMNIGFCDVSAVDVPNTRKKEHLYFGVQGGSMNRSIYLPVTDPKTNMPTDIQLTRGIHQRLKFCRILYRMGGFIDLGTDVHTQLGEIPNSECFDTEFHYRNGLDFYNAPLRPGMSGYKPQSRGGLRNFIASIRCYQSNVNLLYS